MTTPANRVNPSETAEVFSKFRAQAGGIDVDADISNIDKAVIQFTKVEQFTTFMAEYAFVDGNIVVHFFPPREAYVVSMTTQQPKVSVDFLRYWQRTFPQVLSPVAEAFFKATMPIISATYVAEMTSWWMRANGFANGLEPDQLILNFFAELDAALDRVPVLA